jgi:hypothetical protein
MARNLETTLWQLVKADGKSRHVKVRKADNGRWSTGVDGEHVSVQWRRWRPSEGWFRTMNVGGAVDCCYTMESLIIGSRARPGQEP